MSDPNLTPNPAVPQQPQYQQDQWPGYSNAVPPMPPQAPKKAKKKWLVPVLIVAALLLGAGMGNASAAAKPAEIQIQTKEVEKVVEKKVPVPVPTTPSECAAALDYAEDVMRSSARVVGIFSDIIDAVKILDANKITELSPKIDDETVILEDIRPKYQSAAATCRASK